MATSAQPIHFGPVGHQVDKDAHENDLDAKILITSHNSKPGLGKTTLAIKFARALDPNGWNAKEKAFIDPYDYMQAYDEVEGGSVLILDEIEAVADSRRSNASENVDLSQAWATKRYRNIITLATLPTTSMLDKRMIELSDYRINVMRRGAAKAFEVRIPDFPPHRPWQEPIEGMIDYSDLPDDDPDYEHLNELKREFTQVNKQYYSEKELEERIEKVKEEYQMDSRDNCIMYLNENSDLNQGDIADIMNLSRPRVNQIIKANT